MKKSLLDIAFKNLPEENQLLKQRLQAIELVLGIKKRRYKCSTALVLFFFLSLLFILVYEEVLRNISLV